MSNYIVQNLDRSVKLETPNLEDALRFIKENNNGETYRLDFEKTQLLVKVRGNEERRWRYRLKTVPGGKL